MLLISFPVGMGLPDGFTFSMDSSESLDGRSKAATISGPINGSINTPPPHATGSLHRRVGLLFSRCSMNTRTRAIFLSGAVG
jgi:hypothetical protein